MGTTYHYANLTKQEWFSTCALGGNGKWHGLGRNLAARAFELLLVRSHDPNVLRPNQLHWAGDAIAIIGDNERNWHELNAQFTDIIADVILLLYRCDGFDDLAEAAQVDSFLFMQLCHLVATRQAPQFEPHMKRHFGVNYIQHYKDLCNDNRWFQPKNTARYTE